MREELLFRIQEAFRKDEKMSRKHTYNRSQQICGAPLWNDIYGRVHFTVIWCHLAVQMCNIPIQLFAAYFTLTVFFPHFATHVLVSGYISVVLQCSRVVYWSVLRMKVMSFQCPSEKTMHK